MNPADRSLISELITYCHSVINGDTIACQKHVWACLRFLDDIDRSEKNDPDFPYCFIDIKANRFLNWMRLFKHRKGILRGKHIEPHIIQKFIFGNIYGWYHKDTNLRRFDKMYWQVGRKNAKSQSLSCVGSYECGPIDETGLEAFEVYVAATKTEQAKIVYDETAAMLENCELLMPKGKPSKHRYKIANGRIAHIKSGSVMRPLSEEDRKTGDGLNPQCGIIDEYHAHDTAEVYDVIDSGMGARDQALLAIITTAGFALQNPCYRVEYSLVSKILNPDNPVTLDNYFVMINELDKNDTGDDIIVNGKKVPPGELIDDIKDESVWIKANPIACSYEVGVNKIRKALKAALEEPEKMTNFLTKHMNVWVSRKPNGFINVGRWVACGSTKTNPFPNVNRRRVVCGVDLSSSIDLTSVGFVIPLESNKYAVMGHSFMPEETLTQKTKTDKVPYALWEKQGWITVTEGAEVDYHCVLQYIVDTYKLFEWDMGEFTFDKALATWLKQEAERMGFESVIEVPQSYTHLSYATKEIRAKAYAGNIIHNNNPVINWAMGNAVVRTGPSGQILLDKGRAKERIDPAAAILNAMTRAIVNDDKGSVYDERGMREL